MEQDHSQMWIKEIERGLYERFYAWEGKPEQVFDFGEVVVHVQPGLALALCLRFQSDQVDKRLATIMKEVEPLAQRCLWVIGPNTEPVDLEEQLIAKIL